MATSLKERLDYDDLAVIPASSARYEILDGKLHVTPAPSPLHQRVSKRLQRQLEEYFEGSGRGEVFNAPFDVILTPHDVVQPDLVVVDPERLTRRGLESAPILAVEVLSPGSASYDRGAKAQHLARLGVPHLWLVDPEAGTIECMRLAGGAFTKVAEASSPGSLEHPDFPGLRVELGAIWR